MLIKQTLMADIFLLYVKKYTDMVLAFSISRNCHTHNIPKPAMSIREWGLFIIPFPICSAALFKDILKTIFALIPYHIDHFYDIPFLYIGSGYNLIAVLL